MSAIRHFSELRVYQSAFVLQQELFDLSRQFPGAETYGLTSQIRRSSRSVAANIVEAWHKRRYEAQFVFKLTDADAELAETEHWLNTALACNYVSQDITSQFVTDIRNIGGMIGSMMANPEAWTRPYSR